MNSRTELTDEQWEILYQLLLLQGRIYVGNIGRCRRFLNAVLWILRSGAQWHLLPQSLGKWNSVFKRFSRWCKYEVWKFLRAGCSQYPDMQQILIDSTITRAHACAAGAADNSAKAEALGRSKGGFTAKIHAITDTLGNPLGFILTGGQASDIGQAENLLALTAEGAAALVGDKGYDILRAATDAENRIAKNSYNLRSSIPLKSAIVTALSIVMLLFKRSLKKPFSLSFRRAVIELTQEIVIGSRIKSVTYTNPILSWCMDKKFWSIRYEIMPPYYTTK